MDRQTGPVGNPVSPPVVGVQPVGVGYVPDVDGDDEDGQAGGEDDSERQH